MNRKGITLIASIMLIVFVSIAVLGVTTFIVERLKQVEAKRKDLQCVYLAQAGIQQAVYNFRFCDITANGYFSLGKTNIDASNFFVLGGRDADFLMVNTSGSNFTVSNKQLAGLKIQNAINSRSIIIDRIIVTRGGGGGAKLINIYINGSSVWSGNEDLPADCNISNFTLNTTPTIYDIDYFEFDKNVSNKTISIQFVMTDGSSKTVDVYPASQNYNFTIKSTGKTAGSNIYRTIEADYNAQTAKIVNYNEINSEITP